MILTIHFLIQLFFILQTRSTSTDDDKTLTDIFKTSENVNICKSKDGDMDCKDRGTKVFGPKFQHVHLQLHRINPVKKGYERKVRLMKDRTHKMKTLAIYPPIFEIENFLTEDECDAMIYLAKEKGLRNATVTAKNVGISAVNSHQIFDQWDQDIDGSLSPKEISEVSEIKHLLLSDKDVDKMYKDLELDTDKDGKISYGELERVTFEKFGRYLQELTNDQAASSVYNIEQTHLWQDEDELLVFDDVFQDYHQRLSNLTRIPKKLIEESEPLQITLFKNGSHTQCRHDSEPFYAELPCCIYGLSARCRKCRFVSIMFFLNDVEDGGELVFPLADNKTFCWADLHKDSAKVCSKSPNASLSNLAIKPEKGKAIMWYNHFIGRETGWMYTLDPLSLNGASRVENKEKWIARTWINIVGDGVKELRPWKMGNNLLSWNNRRKDIIDAMRNDDFIEDEKYLHDSKLIAIEDDEDDGVGGVKTEESEFLNVNEAYKETVGIEEETKKEETKNETVSIGKDSDDVNVGDSSKELHVNEADKEESKEEKIGDNDNNKKQDDNINIKNIENDLKSKQGEEKKLNSEDKSMKEKNEVKARIDVIENNEQKLPKNETTPESSPKTSNKRNRSPEEGEGPLGPPARISYPNDLKGGKIIENRLVAAVLMLIEELDRDELEIIARSLHEKLQLACIPLMVNPFGPMG